MKAVRLMTVAFLLVTVLCSLAIAGLYYEQEMKTSTQPGSPVQVIKQACYISGAKMRIESEAAGQKSIMIQRYDLGKIYRVMPQHEIVMEITMPEPDPQVVAQQQVTVTKTEETRKVGNYTCIRYDVTTGSGTSQYWMSTDPDVGYEYQKFWQAVDRHHTSKLAREMAKTEGFPIMVVAQTPAGKTTTTVTRVEKHDVPDSMFEVPNDYEAIPVAAIGPKGRFGHSITRLPERPEGALLRIGQTAVDLILEKGAGVTLAQFKGKPVVLAFVSIYSRPSVKVLDELKALQEEKGSDALGAIAVHDRTATLEEIEEFRKEHSISFPIVRVPEAPRDGWDSTTFRAYSITALPTVVLIDAEGNLVSVGDGSNLSQRIEPLLEN